MSHWGREMVFQKTKTREVKSIFFAGAAIAHWTRLHLPSCGPGSKPKHTIYAFIVKFCVIFVIVLRKWVKLNQKRQSLEHIQKKYFLSAQILNVFACLSVHIVIRSQPLPLFLKPRQTIHGAIQVEKASVFQSKVYPYWLYYVKQSNLPLNGEAILQWFAFSQLKQSLSWVPKSTLLFPIHRPTQMSISSLDTRAGYLIDNRHTSQWYLKLKIDSLS